jgi:hypothetical protein
MIKLAHSSSDQNNWPKVFVPHMRSAVHDGFYGYFRVFKRYFLLTMMSYITVKVTQFPDIRGEETDDRREVSGRWALETQFGAKPRSPALSPGELLTGDIPAIAPRSAPYSTFVRVSWGDLAIIDILFKPTPDELADTPNLDSSLQIHTSGSLTALLRCIFWKHKEKIPKHCHLNTSTRRGLILPRSKPEIGGRRRGVNLWH